MCVTPAWLSGDERRRGRLIPGHAADLVVLDRDPWAASTPRWSLPWLGAGGCTTLRPGLGAVSARPEQVERPVAPLELFFDLVFVFASHR